MKTIQPVSVWSNGQSVSATLMSVVSVYDDLNTYATFAYQLMVEDPNLPGNGGYSSVATGNIQMSGQDYIDWDNSNDAAYQFVAGKLNITLV